MNITLCDITEAISPLIAISACCFRLKRTGKDNITLLSFFTFLMITVLNTYAVYLGAQQINNIHIYTLEHFIMLSSFSYLTFDLIKKKFKWFFLFNIATFIIVLFFVRNTFDAVHSINPLLTGLFSFTMILYGLLILLFVIKDKFSIKTGYYKFSIWFAAALITYFVSTFLLYTFFDALQLLNKEITDVFWEVSVLCLLSFFIILSIAQLQPAN